MAFRGPPRPILHRPLDANRILSVPLGLEFEGNEEHVRLVEKDDGRAVATLLATLEPAHQDVLVLRYIEDLSIPEIAKRLDISENTVSVRIHRAQALLRDTYKDNPKYGTI